jgi:hypothetical protein
MGHLKIPRVDEGAPPPATGGTRTADAPSVAAIRMVFGVGAGPDKPAADVDFKPVYSVSLPVFSLGGLDPDGVHEFDAVRMLETLQARSTRRRWAMRLELEIVQTADTVAAADIHVTTPYAAGEGEGPALMVHGRSQRGVTTPGGGRSLTLVSSLVHEPAAIAALAGSFAFALRDVDPGAEGVPSVESPARALHVALDRFEFEG